MPGKRLVWVRHRDGNVEVQRRGKSPPPGINRAREPPKPSFWDWAAGPNPRKLRQMQESIAFHRQAMKEKEKEKEAHASEMPPDYSRKSQGWPSSSSSQMSQASASRSSSIKYHFNDPPLSSNASAGSVDFPKAPTDLVPFPDLDTADEKRRSRKDKYNLDGTNEKDGKKKRETNPITFTPEQDKKLQELKAANKTWKEIAVEMETPPEQISQLKERFKTIGTTEASAANAWDNDSPPWEDATTPAANSGAEKRPKRLKHADFERDETDALHKLAKQDERARWERVARKYFEETGRRVVARDIERVLTKR